MKNSDTNRWLALCPQNVPILMKNKRPGYIMVFGDVNRDDNVMTHFIYPHGSRLFPDVYIRWLEVMVLTWIERVTPGLFFMP